MILLTFNVVTKLTYLCYISLCAGDSGAVSIAFSDYSAGEHVLTLSASDAAGKTAVWESPFNVTGMKYHRSCLT